MLKWINIESRFFFHNFFSYLSHSNLYLLHSFSACRIDDAFSTEIGPELARIVEPIRWLWTSSSSAKIRNKKDLRGSPVASPMPKSVLSGGREDQLLRE